MAYSRQLSQALTGFGDGHSFWVDFRRRPVNSYLGHESEFRGRGVAGPATRTPKHRWQPVARSMTMSSI